MTIDNQRKIISIKANSGDFSPKKIIGHKAFNISCIPKVETEIFATLLSIPLLQIRYKEIPIKRYNVIQTGPNNQPGGLKSGLFKVKYQVDTEEIVKSEPTTPAN